VRGKSGLWPRDHYRDHYRAECGDFTCRIRRARDDDRPKLRTLSRGRSKLVKRGTNHHHRGATARPAIAVRVRFTAL